jgi:predicted dehydrogenase
MSGLPSTDTGTAMAQPVLKVGLVGIGKIAHDQHLPTIGALPGWELAATASREGGVSGVPCYTSIEAMLAGEPALDAVSIATPTGTHHEIARRVIAAGLSVMIEKPPAATLGAVAELATLAAERSVTLFTTWHSRETPAVDLARDWLARRCVRSVTVSWREDIRVWHPGQDWILAPAGMGVFDPAINALSILTHILGRGLVVESAELDVPANRHTAIAASVQLRWRAAPVKAELDFLHPGAPDWTIAVDTDGGLLELSDGGHRLRIAGEQQDTEQVREYDRLYRRFAGLIARGESSVDWEPLQLVADALLIGRRRTVGSFEF